MTSAMNPDHENRQAPFTYAEEVLCANWHPLVRMLAEPGVRVQKAELDAGEAGDLLARV